MTVFFIESRIDVMREFRVKYDIVCKVAGYKQMTLCSLNVCMIAATRHRILGIALWCIFINFRLMTKKMINEKFSLKHVCFYKYYWIVRNVIVKFKAFSNFTGLQLLIPLKYRFKYSKYSVWKLKFLMDELWWKVVDVLPTVQGQTARRVTNFRPGRSYLIYGGAFKTR